MPCYAYIMASRRNGTLYTGVTNDVARRGLEHREGVGAGFTKRYGVKLLVYYEAHDEIQSAVEREKRLKKWNRAWKISLIEAANPKWQDLYETLAV
jgi:putative endonuclease